VWGDRPDRVSRRHRLHAQRRVLGGRFRKQGTAGPPPARDRLRGAEFRLPGGPPRSGGDRVPDSPAVRGAARRRLRLAVSALLFRDRFAVPGGAGRRGLARSGRHRSCRLRAAVLHMGGTRGWSRLGRRGRPGARDRDAALLLRDHGLGAQSHRRALAGGVGRAVALVPEPLAAGGFSDRNRLLAASGAGPDGCLSRGRFQR
jgi:hypothetical protein